MKKKGIALALASLAVLCSVACTQKKSDEGKGPRAQQQKVAPLTLNEDGSVTIRYVAPETVKSVKINGDFLPMVVSEGRHGLSESFPAQEMTKGENNVWEYTSAPLQPDLYKYWFDVDGVQTTDPNNGFVTRAGKVLASNYFILPFGSSANYITQKDVPHGTLSARWYHSDHAGFDKRTYVYTPAGYEEGKDKYPVLYVFHGASEDETAWITQGRVVEIMDNLIARGECKPMIVVVPNINPWDQAGFEVMNYDNSQQPAMNDVQARRIGKDNFDYYENERYFNEVISFIDKSYRTLPDKHHRAVCGVSMGGRNAMNVSRIQRNTFGYVGLFSPALEPENHFPEAKYDEEIIGSLRQQAADGVDLYWIGVGPNDLQWQTNIPFRAILDEVGMPYSFNPSEGAHTYNNWRHYLMAFAAELFK